MQFKLKLRFFIEAQSVKPVIIGLAPFFFCLFLKATSIIQGILDNREKTVTYTAIS